MIETLLAAMSLCTVLQCTTGYVTPYAPGVMEAVAERRARYFGQLRGYRPDCLAATNHNAVGDYLLVWWPGQRAVLCRVADCAQSTHVDAREMDGLVLETDAETYRQYGRGPVQIVTVSR